jgi:hypothetical protein
MEFQPVTQLPSSPSRLNDAEHIAEAEEADGDSRPHPWWLWGSSAEGWKGISQRRSREVRAQDEEEREKVMAKPGKMAPDILKKKLGIAGMGKSMLTKGPPRSMKPPKKSKPFKAMR